MGRAQRKSVPMYIELALRDLVANSVLHQDFFVTGAVGPVVEIFEDLLEITTTDKKLITTERFWDTPPESRNESLASFIRRVGVSKERGSKVNKVVSQMEFYQLPAPAFEVPEYNTRAVLFAHRPLTRRDKEDRIRVTYVNASLRCVNRGTMTNTTLRGGSGSASNSRTAPWPSASSRKPS